MLSDIIREFLDVQADIEIVALLGDTDPLEPAVLRHAAELAILSDPEFRVPKAWLDLLAIHPDLRILAVASEGHRGALCEVFGNVKPQELVTVVESGKRRA